MSLKSGHNFQTVVSRYDFQQKKPNLSGEIADLKSGVGNLQYKCGTFCHTRGKKLSNTAGIISK